MNNNKLKVEIGKMPPNFRFLGVLILLIGASLVVASNYWGIVIMLPAGTLLFYKEGYIFELEEKKMCNYSTIGFIHWQYGEKVIRNYSFLSIVRVGVRSRMHSRGMSYSSTALRYKLTLIKNDKEYFKIVTDEYFKVFSIGKKIANHYSLGLVDYSKGEANWVLPKAH